MKTKSLLLLYSLCALAACSTESQQEADTATTAEARTLQADTLHPAEAGAPAEPVEPETGAGEISYQEELTTGEFTFGVSTTGQGSRRNLTILVARAGQPPTRIDEVVEGSVTRSVVSDLNGNAKPELLVFVTGSGTGSYGKVYGYEFERQYWGQLKLPELTPGLQQDYRGHDAFEVTGNRLVRTFPIYLETDPNCCPTGGQHKIIYALDKALNLKVEQAE